MALRPCRWTSLKRRERTWSSGKPDEKLPRSLLVCQIISTEVRQIISQATIKTSTRSAHSPCCPRWVTISSHKTWSHDQGTSHGLIVCDIPRTNKNQHRHSKVLHIRKGWLLRQRISLCSCQI